MSLTPLTVALTSALCVFLPTLTFLSVKYFTGADIFAENTEKGILPTFKTPYVTAHDRIASAITSLRRYANKK